MNKRCFHCNSLLLTTHGKTKNNSQRYKCSACKKTSIKYNVGAGKKINISKYKTDERNKSLQKIDSSNNEAEILELSKLSSYNLLRLIKKKSLITIAQNCDINPKFTELAMKYISDIEKKGIVNDIIDTDINEQGEFNDKNQEIIFVLRMYYPEIYKELSKVLVSDLVRGATDKQDDLADKVCNEVKSGILDKKDIPNNYKHMVLNNQELKTALYNQDGTPKTEIEYRKKIKKLVEDK